MAKKKKHLKTDRRSVERRQAREEKQRKETYKLQQKLTARYAPREEMFKAADEGRVFRPSVKQLKKWRREQESGVLKTEAKPEKVLSPEEKERIRQNNLKKQWIKKRHEENIAAFQKWKYSTPLRNIHGYSFVNEEDIPFMNPQNAKEIARDRKLWELFHEAVENPNIDEARELYNKAMQMETEILRQQAGGQEKFASYVKELPKMSLRAASAMNKNQEWLNYYNYLEAANARGLDIFAEAIKSGGKAFVDWLYKTVKFDWRNFYANDAGDIATDVADVQFKNIAREYRNKNIPYADILNRAYDRYMNEGIIA